MTIALIYHDVADPADRDATGFPGPLANRYKLSPADFAAHLDAIAAERRPVGLWRPGAPAPAVALTFDDGGASSREIAAMLEARGWRGHFFITTDRIGTPGFLDADGVRDLHARGHVIGSHSVTHPAYFGRLSGDELAREWGVSREVLGEVLGQAPDTAAVPGGSLSRRVIEEAARAGYAMLMTSEPVTRAPQRAGMTVAGRFTVWESTPPAVVAAYARGARGARARIWLEWNAKTLAKRLSPRIYDAARRIRARSA
jgi:peptidoglycan/xylan/chitin deacetylase (PgdA/CDA1 family)